MATKSPNLVKDINLQNQEAQSSSTENHAQTNHSHTAKNHPQLPTRKKQKIIESNQEKEK